MSDDVFSRVEQLDKKDVQPNLLVFPNTHNENLLDGTLDDDDLSYATEVDFDENQEVNSDLSEMSDVTD